MLSPQQQFLGSLTIALPQPIDLQRELLPRIDAAALVVAATREGLAGLLYANLRRADLAGTVPDEVTEQLEAAYRRTAALNMQKTADLRALVPLLETARADVVVLKGMALLEALYRDPGLRPTGDIDLWVDAASRDTVTATLERLGYTPEPFYPETFRRRSTTIDVHTHVLTTDRIRARETILATGEGPLLAGRRDIWDDGGEALRLGRAPELLLLTLHLLKHNADRLLWLIEVNELTARCSDGEWEDLRQLARDMGQQRSLFRVALLADLLLPRTVTPRLLALYQQDEPSRLEARALRQRATRGTLPVWAPLLFFSSQHGVAERAISIFETLFPRPAVLRQVFRDADSSAWRLYLRRVGQLFELVLR